MFIDHNNSGTYDDGDTLIPVPANAVRIEQAHQKSLIQDGVLQTGLLRAYNRYNVVVNSENLPNPMLIPTVNLFSFYTDPNQFKTIDIPLYHAGIIEGRVLRQVSTDQTQAVSGLRMLLLQADGKYEMTFTTFFDGLFYSMEIPPGNYILKPDPEQLKKMNVKTTPGSYSISIEPAGQGQLVEELNFILY